MAISLSTITGAAVTGLTSPTYTVTADNAITGFAKQWLVSGTGGTQTGVDVHTIDKVFTISFSRSNPKPLPPADPKTGIISNIPMNTYKIIGRKGVIPSANQGIKNCMIRTEISIPAGSTAYEPEDIRALVSAYIGSLSQQSDNIATMLLTGVV